MIYFSDKNGKVIWYCVEGESPQFHKNQIQDIFFAEVDNYELSRACVILNRQCPHGFQEYTFIGNDAQTLAANWS